MHPAHIYSLRVIRCALRHVPLCAAQCNPRQGLGYLWLFGTDLTFPLTPDPPFWPPSRTPARVNLIFHAILVVQKIPRKTETKRQHPVDIDPLKY
jgi:hypothetical protein